jgi:hypothetical protein
MINEYHEKIEQCKKSEKHNSIMLCILFPFVIAQGYVFYILYLNNGASFTSIGSLLMFISIFIIIYCKFCIIRIDRKMIKLYERIIKLEDF